MVVIAKIGRIAEIRNSYRDQLFHYYEQGIGAISDITGVIITDGLISTIEKRYRELGGIIPIHRQKQ